MPDRHTHTQTDTQLILAEPSLEQFGDKFSFFVRTVEEWSNLDKDIGTSKSIESFKNKIQTTNFIYTTL